MMPSDYITNITSGSTQITAEMVENLRRLYGLDGNIFQGYLQWMSNAIRGNFGTSFMYQRPVVEVIASKMGVTFAMAIVAFFIQLVLGVTLGTISATRQYSKLDYSVTIFALLGISLPSFFFSAVLQRVFAVGLGWFPLQGMLTARIDHTTKLSYYADMAYHLVLPILVFVVVNVGRYMRYSRTNMLEVLNADYIRTARAKGLSEGTVLYKHAFRNTLIPLATIIGGALPTLFTGAIITEGIFGIDGLGYTALQALTKGDVPYLMTFNMFIAVMTLLGNLLSDILYGIVDPRVRLS